MKSVKYQWRSLAISAGAVLVLGAVLILLWFGFRTEETAQEESSSPELRTVSVVPETITQLSKMEVKNPEGSFTIVPDGDAYRVEELGDLPQDLTLVQYLAESTFDLTTSSDIGEVEDLAEYGLADPVITITLAFDDGGQKTLLMGNTVPFDEESRYFCTPDSSYVYVVKADEHLAEGPEAFVSTKVIRSESGEEGDSFSFLALWGSDFPEKLVVTQQDGVYRMVEPVSADVDQSQVNYAAVQLSGLTAQEAVAVHPSAELLTSLGFDTPRTELEATLNGVYYHIKVAPKDSDTDYVLIDGMDVVYQVLRSNISAWSDLDRLSLQDSRVSTIGIEEIAQLHYQSEETSFQLSATRTEDPSRSTEDKTYYSYQAQINGVSLDSAAYEAFADAAGALTIVEHELPGEGAAEAILTWKTFEGLEHRLELIPFDDTLARAVLDGSQMGLVRQSAVRKLQQAAATLMQG